ncbi:hypothetical protein TNCV_2838211 [Trichonephila clavipes]|nr:hypothetical protein TNCV_2838211 [Trichonephila clavipes]
MLPSLLLLSLSMRENDFYYWLYIAVVGDVFLYEDIGFGVSFPNGRKESCRSLRQVGLLHDRWRHQLYPPPQFRGRDWRGVDYSPAPFTSCFCCDLSQDFWTH